MTPSLGNEDNDQDASLNSANEKEEPLASTQNGDGKASASDVDVEFSWRQMVGRGMDSVSKVINENIIAARYATFASIVLLSAYGIFHTPLFFRFKSVKDIPASFFLNRRTIRGRLVRVVDNVDPINADVEMPIVCLVRHLSPIGRLLGRSAFDFVMRSHPAASVESSSDEEKHELLRVEIAAVREPPPYTVPSYEEQRGEWLRRLADQKATISCQLLARRSRIENVTKRNTAALEEFGKTAGDEQTAVARVSFRPGGHLFRRDMAESLVRHGRASILSGMFVSLDNWVILDTSDRVEDLKKDAKYMNRLEKAEYEAAKEEVGMWTDELVRDDRRDLVDEITFQTEASLFQKAWRWLARR